MSGVVNGKLPADPKVNKPAMQPRPSSSNHRPTKYPPGQVIEISDSDDDDGQVEIISGAKGKPPAELKRPSSSSTRHGGYDVSCWNRGPQTKPPPQIHPRDPLDRPVLSSSTRRSNVISQSPRSKSTSDRQSLFDNAHKPNEKATRAGKQTNELTVTQARAAIPLNGQSNLINKLNSFSNPPSSLSSRNNSNRQDETSSSVRPSELRTSINNARRSLGESNSILKLQAIAAHRSARHSIEGPRSRLEVDSATDTGCASQLLQNWSCASKDPTTTRNSNIQSGTQSFEPTLASSSSSAPARGNNNSAAIHASGQTAGAMAGSHINAPLREESHSGASDGVVHARKKVKHDDRSQSRQREDRFTELVDSDSTEPPVPSNSCQPPRQSTSKPASFRTAPQANNLDSSGRPANRSTLAPETSCAVHPFPLLPLPPVIPRCRPQSPDWSRIPRHKRPLQGRERPEEFSDELQKTWILNNDPDLSTPLGHLIFSDEINANQMWENPEIPRIDVVVPDDVKEQMLEDSKAAKASQGAKPARLDQSLAPPLEFIYTDRLVYRNNERPIPARWHCNCHGDCLNNPNCECRAYQSKKIREIAAACDFELGENVTNFEGFAYISHRKPRHSHHKKPENGDMDARSISEIFTTGTFPVFECNSLCRCGPDCINRTVGRGRREKLSIEKTVSRGWGVFADHTIPVGRLVTHYSGELITDAMSWERGEKIYDKIGRTYIFDLDPWWIKTVSSQTLANEGLLVLCEANTSSQVQKTLTAGPSNSSHQNLNGSRTTSSSTSKKKQKKKSNGVDDNEVECIYSVDAFLYGNISRFINHSCSANTAVVPVYIDDSDPTRPIFAMFAQKMIKPGMEITTSYSDPNADAEDMMHNKIRQGTESHMGRYMQCKCGAPNCKGIMFA